MEDDQQQNEEQQSDEAPEFDPEEIENDPSTAGSDEPVEDLRGG